MYDKQCRAEHVTGGGHVFKGSCSGLKTTVEIQQEQMCSRKVCGAKWRIQKLGFLSDPCRFFML